jgi:AcrR family transcriptional regulator
VLLATLDVFGERGWARLSVEEIARRSGVGKSAIYLRWKDKRTLLCDALRGVQLSPSEAAEQDTAVRSELDDADDVPLPGPSLREYLIEHAMHRALLYLGPHGPAVLRLYMEIFTYPDVFTPVREQALTAFVLSERRRVKTAVSQGELPPGASAVHLLDAIEGAVFIHVLVTPPALRERVRSGLRDYVEDMVDHQLRAVGYRG